MYSGGLRGKSDQVPLLDWLRMDAGVHRKVSRVLSKQDAAKEKLDARFSGKNMLEALACDLKALLDEGMLSLSSWCSRHESTDSQFAFSTDASSSI